MKLTSKIISILCMLSLFSCNDEISNELLNIDESYSIESSEEAHKERFQKLKDELNLSEEQSVKLQELFSTLHEQRKIVKRERKEKREYRSAKKRASKEDREIHREKRHEMRNNMRASVKKILTDEQYQTFLTIKKKTRPHKGKRHMKRRLKHMAKELELTDAQKDKIKLIIKEKRDAIEVELESKEVSREERHELIKLHRKAIKEEIATILTSEQREKAEALKLNHK